MERDCKLAKFISYFVFYFLNCDDYETDTNEVAAGLQTATAATEFNGNRSCV